MKKHGDKIKQRVALRNYTLGGRVSTVLAALAIVALVAAIIISFVKEGNGGTIIGILAMMTLIFSVVGFFVGFKSFYEKGTTFLKYTWIGTIANTVIVLFLFGMFLAYV
jgi:hypothetical protein